MQRKTVLREVYTYVLNKIFFFKKQCIFKAFVQNQCFTYVLKGIFVDYFLAYLAIGTFGQLGPSGNWDLWVIGTLGQLGPLFNWEIRTFGDFDKNELAIRM